MGDMADFSTSMRLCIDSSSTWVVGVEGCSESRILARRSVALCSSSAIFDRISAKSRILGRVVHSVVDCSDRLNVNVRAHFQRE
jgi:hypothetical protein